MRERKLIDVAARAAETEKGLTELERRIRERQSPAGSLGLPSLLDERRLRFAIPDGAFRTQAVFDRILVWQVSDWEGETYGDTMIVMPELAKARTQEAAPRGILISAGQLALDGLRSNGIELGHVVRFIRLAPWRMRVDTIGGQEQHALILRSGDLIGSEDLRDELRSNPGAISFNAETGQHEYMGAVRTSPDHPDDY